MHGTNGCYCRGCREPECKAAHAQVMRMWYENNREHHQEKCREIRRRTWPLEKTYRAATRTQKQLRKYTDAQLLSDLERMREAAKRPDQRWGRSPLCDL